MRYSFKISLLAFFATLLIGIAGCEEKETKAVITTEFGEMTILLYNSTPKHRDNFIKLVKDGFYDDLLFHRVIEGFMIQGGDPASKSAGAGTALGSGGPGYEIEAEIGSPHLRGALAAARTPNPEKKSSGSQFYIVTGRKITENELAQFERMKKITYNEEQRKIYLEQGGTPSLDMEYTVFGEVLSGIEVADKISQVQKDERDRPTMDVRMKIKLIH